MNPDATREILLAAPSPAPTRHETPRPTCDETAPARWPDSPGNWCGWPWDRCHIFPAGRATRRTAQEQANRAATGAGWRKKSGMYSLPAGTPVQRPSPHRLPWMYEYQSVSALAWAVHPLTTAARP